MPLVLLLGLPACLFLSDDDLSLRQDVDQDGVSAAEDCDDADPAVGAPTIWYLDGDGDGFGDPDQAQAACGPPTSRHLALAEDCDDSDASVNPDGQEACNGDGGDEDCDGLVDDDDPDAILPVWYLDSDEDGWGVAEPTLASCEPGSGWALQVGDCDDDAADVSPDGVEVCGDGVDQDCTPSPDCGLAGDQLATSLPGTAQITLSDPGVSRALFGGAATHTGDFNGDGYGDFAAGATGSDKTASVRQSGAVYLFTSPPADGATGSQALVQLLGPSLGDRAGASLSGLPDRDGDGTAELLVGVPESGDLGPGTGPGHVVLVAGGSGALTGDLGDSLRELTLTGQDAGDRAGTVVTAIGDFDGDGTEDFAVGAPGARDGARSGLVYIVLDPLTSGNSYALGDVSALLVGPEDATLRTGQGLGEALAGRQDLDGDGYPDLLVGNPSADDERGEALVFRGDASLSPFLSMADAQATLLGTDPGGLLGSQVLLTEGLANDTPELVVAAPLANDDDTTSGVVHVLSADLAQGTVDLAVEPGLTLTAGSELLFGYSLAGRGDFNADGQQDLAVAALLVTGQDVVNLFYGPLTGPLDADQAQLHVLADNDGLGAALGLDSDLTGDGVDDLLVGAPNTGDDGAVWTIPGVGE